jgi:hypothetical protein
MGWDCSTRCMGKKFLSQNLKVKDYFSDRVADEGTLYTS